MITLVAIVVGVGLFILLGRLQERVTRLEEQVRRLGSAAPAAAPATAASTPSVPAMPVFAAPGMPASIPSAPPTPTGPTPGERFIDWLVEDWLLKLGVFLLLIGFGWLTTYAFLNNWIGPAGRIMLGLATGLALMLFGWWRMRSYIHQGGVFLVFGSTTILLTIFAARSFYGFFTPGAALGVMFLSTAFVAMVSVQYQRAPLALASLILAGFAPLLTHSPNADYISLFAYLLAVVLGTLWIVALTGKRELTTAALLLVSFYSAPHLLSFTSFDAVKLLPFAFIFSLLFFIAHTVGIVRSTEAPAQADLVTAGGNGLFLLAWIMTAAPAEIQSLLIAAWMVVFAVGAFIVFSYTGRREPFFVYGGVSVMLLAAATAAELEGAVLTIAFAIEACLLPMITYALTKDSAVASRVGWAFLLPSLLSLESIFSNNWQMGVVHRDFFVLLVMTLALLECGLFLLTRENAKENEETRHMGDLLLIAGSIYGYALLWLSLHAALANNNTAVLISLAVYTIIGLITYSYGLSHNRPGIRHYGGVLIVFVVGRLLLVDVWLMALAGRILTFLSIGTLLITSAFFGKKGKSATPTP